MMHQRMTRIEFDDLRLRYRAAFDLFVEVTTQIIESSKSGHRPPESDLFAEEEGLWELARLRREFLDALLARQPPN